MTGLLNKLMTGPLISLLTGLLARVRRFPLFLALCLAVTTAVMAYSLPWWALSVLSVFILWPPFKRLRVFIPVLFSGFVFAFAAREIQNGGAGSRVWSQLLYIEYLERFFSWISFPGVELGRWATSISAVLLISGLFTALNGLFAYAVLCLKEIVQQSRQ